MEAKKEMPEKENKSGKDEFHYHYDASGKDSNRDLLRTAGKVALAGPLVLCYIFYAAMLLVGCLLIGGAIALLGGGSLFCFGVGGYLGITGIGQITAGIVTGIGVVGMALLILICAILFLIGLINWVKKGIPTVLAINRKFRAWFSDEGAKQ